MEFYSPDEDEYRFSLVCTCVEAVGNFGPLASRERRRDAEPTCRDLLTHASGTAD
jgi:hypothetical protein